jgi:hypothetical protein
MSRRSGGSVWPSAATLRPASRTSPLLIGRKPATALSRVDLPEPDGPSSATTSPSRTVRFTELRTGVEPYAIDRSRSSRTFDTSYTDQAPGLKALGLRTPVRARAHSAAAGSTTTAVMSTESAAVTPTPPRSALFNTTTAKVSLPGP